MVHLLVDLLADLAPLKDPAKIFSNIFYEEQSLKYVPVLKKREQHWINMHFILVLDSYVLAVFQSLHLQSCCSSVNFYLFSVFMDDDMCNGAVKRKSIEWRGRMVYRHNAVHTIYGSRAPLDYHASYNFATLLENIFLSFLEYMFPDFFLGFTESTLSNFFLLFPLTFLLSL